MSGADALTLQGLHSKRRWVETGLSEHLTALEDCPKTLAEAMWFSTSGPGKRLRSVLGLAAMEAVGARPAPVPRALLAIELVHAASLILDDLPCMDDATQRRGRLATHCVYGEASTILAAVALLVEAFDWCARSQPPHPYEATRLVGELATAIGRRGLVAGQDQDLRSSSEMVSASLLQFIHERKTAALFRAAASIGGILGGADEDELTALSQFGSSVGLAFQIADDLLDVEGESASAGKPTGADARNDVLTSVSVWGRRDARRHSARLGRASASGPGSPAPWACRGAARDRAGGDAAAVARWKPRWRRETMHSGDPARGGETLAR